MAPSPSKDYVGYIQQQLAKFEMKNHLQSALKRSNLWEQLVRNQSHNLQSSDNENPMETTSEVAALFKWAQCGPPRLLPQKSRRKVANIARSLTYQSSSRGYTYMHSAYR